MADYTRFMRMLLRGGELDGARVLSCARDNALRVLDAHDPTQPLFLYYAAHIAHQPYEVPGSYNASFAFIPDAPQLIPPLPYDFFYPFYMAPNPARRL